MNAKQRTILQSDAPLTPTQLMELSPSLREELRTIQTEKHTWLSAKWIDHLYRDMLGNDDDEQF